jgi:hypothetical protein
MSRSAAEWFEKTGWAFVPGPSNDSAPMNSCDLKELVEYAPEKIAATVLSYPGMRLLHINEPGWWDWKARWESADEFIELNMTLMGRSDQLWGGSEIKARCHPSSLVAVWKHLKAEGAGIWLHDPDCRMHTERSFLDAMTTPSETAP